LYVCSLRYHKHHEQILLYEAGQFRFIPFSLDMLKEGSELHTCAKTLYCAATYKLHALYCEASLQRYP
jgi:hypothetical protein